MITHSVVKWPGAVHDARIFSGSGLKNIYETGIKHNKQTSKC